MSLTAELRAAALRCAASVEPDVMTGDQAAAAVQDLATVEKAAATARMFLALRVAKTNAWQGHGHKTAADWLAAQLGISVPEAGRQLGTARKAERLPKTKEKMREGELSPEQADAVTDAATADPAAEDDLLDLAGRATTKNLKDEAARRKAAATDTETRDRRIHAERSLRRRVGPDGAFTLHLRGTAADGARIEALLRPFEQQAFRTGRRHGVRDTFENRSYDAMLALLGLGPRPPTDAAPASTTAARSATATATGAAPGDAEPFASASASSHVDPTAPPPGATAAPAPAKPGEAATSRSSSASTTPP